MISPELFAISGFAKPATNVDPRSCPAYAVATFPEANDRPPEIALAPLLSNALTTPSSVCKSVV